VDALALEGLNLNHLVEPLRDMPGVTKGGALRVDCGEVDKLQSLVQHRGLPTLERLRFSVDNDNDADATDLQQVQSMVSLSEFSLCGGICITGLDLITLPSPRCSSPLITGWPEIPHVAC
jgi:hypothetical protein